MAELLRSSWRHEQQPRLRLPVVMGSIARHPHRMIFFFVALITCTVLILIPYLVAYNDPETVRSFITESRFSEHWHRIFGWGDTVVHLNHTFSSEESKNLKEVLQAAAFRGNTVIFTTLNGAWAAEGNMLELFLESFKVGEGTKALLDHLVIVALDQVAYNRCTQVHRHCFSLKTDGVDFSREKYFMSSDYMKMMWRRVDFMRIILEMGYNFLFSDADIMFFRDPFQRFLPNIDFQIACDKYNGNPTDLTNKPNGGFLYVPSNNRTIRFFNLWYVSRLSYPGQNEQDVFNILKFTEFTPKGLSVRFLDTEVFSGFCRPSKDFGKVCTMHANCCRGLDNKIRDLRRIIDDWNRFMLMTPEERKVSKLGWSNKECLRKPRP